MQNKSISVAGIQLLHEEGSREFNLKRAISMIRSAPGHHLYVLPELACSGYGPRAFDKLAELAENDHGPSFQTFSALAREQQCFICYSYPGRKAGKPTITAAVVGPTGELLVVYDKWHVCQFGECSEKDYFDPGNRPLKTFAINGIRVGICICYDIRFPELTRKLALEENITLLIHPGGWPRDEGFSTWHTFVATRAIENSIYIMSPNRAGANNGGTVFCPPFVDYRHTHPTSLEDEEGILIGEVDPDHLAEVRQTYMLLEDRRPDMYQSS